MLTQLALAFLLAASQAEKGSLDAPGEEIRIAVASLQSARASGDRLGALNAARRAVAVAPANPVLRTFLAQTAASAGEPDLARETLEWLAARGYGVGERARPELASLLSDKRSAALARRLARNATPSGSFAAVVQVSGEVDSEGVTYDPRRGRTYLANDDGVFAVDPDGSSERVLAPDALQGRLVLGVRYDLAQDRIFVCSSSGSNDSKPGAELVVLYPASPAKVERFNLGPAEQPRLCNDIAVLSGGAAVTDTNNGEILRYRDGDGVSRLTEVRFAFPNGIIQVGERIIVADLVGLWVLALDGRILGQMRTAEGDYLGGIDGLVAEGDRLIGVQNLTTPPRVVSFRLGEGLLLSERKLLAAGARELEGMTTATIRNNALLILSSPSAAAMKSKALVELNVQ